MTSERTWSGHGTFFDGTTSETVGVRVTILPAGVVVLRNELPVFYRYARLKPAEGAGTATLWVRIADSNESILSIDDAEAEAVFTEHRRASRNFIKKIIAEKHVLVPVLVAAVLLVLFFSFGVNLLAHVGVMMLPHEMDRYLGERVVSEVRSTHDIAADSSTAHILKKCATVMQNFNRAETPDTFSIFIIEDESVVNAFALPGGAVFVFRGMLNHIEHEDELFGLLAHEAGHVVERHGMKRIARSVLFSLLTSLLLGDAQGVSSVLLSNSEMLISLSYDREEELEADRFGVNAVTEAGINPEGLTRLFRKLQQEADGPRWTAFLSTHPDLEDRITRLTRETSGQTGTEFTRYLTPDEWKTLTASSPNTEKEHP